MYTIASMCAGRKDGHKTLSEFLDTSNQKKEVQVFFMFREDGSWS